MKKVDMDMLKVLLPPSLEKREDAAALKEAIVEKSLEAAERNQAEGGCEDE